MKTRQWLQALACLGLTLLTLTSCDPKGPSRTMLVEAEVPMKKTLNLDLNVEDLIDLPSSKALRSATDKVLYQGVHSWDIQEALGQSDISLNDIKQLQLDKITLACISPAGVDLNALAPIHLYVGSDKHLVAETKVETSKSSEINLILHDKDLTNYIKADELPILVTSSQESIPDWPDHNVKTMKVQITLYGTATVLVR